MKKTKILATLAVLVLFSISCALTSGIGGVVGGKNAGTVNDLWQDVPKMDGMTKVNVDLPLPARLAIQAFVRASSQGEGSLDFIAYNTKSTPDEVASFYTLDRMTAAGWNMQDQTGCQGEQGPATQTAGGGVCFFGKDNGNGKSSYLVLFFGQDSKTKETQVFFMRVETTNPPTATP